MCFDKHVVTLIPLFITPIVYTLVSGRLTFEIRVYQFFYVLIYRMLITGTIFAYGQTGTGKTYTMEGKLYSLSPLSYHRCVTSSFTRESCQP